MSIITTISGIEFDLSNPTPDMITIEDVSHALSHQCRFNGHFTGEFYSVARHSVGVSYLVDDFELQLAALLHDAAEAYIGDIVTPLKSLLTEIHGIERSILRAVAVKFGFDPRLFDRMEIRRADLQMLYAERQFMIPHNKTHWACFDVLEGDYRLDKASHFITSCNKTFLERFYALI